jgi:hypothetical protein
VLSELERHGYVVEPHSASSANGAICRHPEAPTLMVTEEGQLELVEGEPVNRISMPPQIAGSRIHHGRALLILTLLAVATFVGLLFVAMIVG